ncbi:protein kinase domain-containing protein [Ditylenchus destructor]|nr:protein kinase domain-containing protein [Ditylenchus destructor]
MATSAINPKLSADKIITCQVVNGEDKHLTIYELKNDDSTCVQRSFSDIEKMYEKLRNSLPASLDRPPKKKFLVAEARLQEKRKIWVEHFVNLLMSKYYENCDVQNFFGPLLISQEENFVFLGPSEKKSIKPNHFDYLKTIGQGSFGRVFMVRHHGDGKIYAMKVLGKEHIKMRNEVKHVMAERNVLLTNIHHPFLVSLHYSFQTKEKLYFVLDFLNGGELFFHLQKERCFSEQRARFYAAEIASALGYLHEKDIIYRDLKPENLLLDRLGHVVLTDFGLCKEGIKLKDTTNTFCGTPEYLAPEVIRKKPYDRTVDWWCLGSVLYEMMFGLPPFYSKNQNEMYEKTLNQPLSIPHTASPPARTILSQMLNKDRAERLGAKTDFDEIRDHIFFITIDWEKLLNREMKPPFVPKVRCETDTVNISREFVDIEPNQASLAPTNTYCNPDNEFPGFTYQQKPMLHLNE